MPRPRDILPTPDPGPYRAGRVCSEPGCTTILHRRHEGTRCYVHAEPELVTFKESREDLVDLMQAA